MYQQVEGDKDNELHVDDGDEDTDNIYSSKYFEWPRVNFMKDQWTWELDQSKGNSWM